jgi:hypothetical protein
MGPDLHPATEALLRFFEYDHLPEHLQKVSGPFCELANDIAWRKGLGLEGAELTTALRKLLEAKDCAVRAALPKP